MRDDQAVLHARDIVEAIRADLDRYAGSGMTVGEVAQQLSRLEDAIAVLDLFFRDASRER